MAAIVGGDRKYDRKKSDYEIELTPDKLLELRDDVRTSGKPCDSVTAARYLEDLDATGHAVMVITCDGSDWKYYTVDGSTARY